MSLLDVVNAGILTAHKVVKPLEATVLYQKCVFSNDGFNTKSYPTSVPLIAIVEQKYRPINTGSGEYMASNASLLFIDLAAVRAATGPGGVAQEDRFVLPGETQGTAIIAINGLIDPITKLPMPLEVMLG